MAAVKDVKITFYDSEKGCAVEAFVSKADAERAKNDIYFATELLRNVNDEDAYESFTTEEEIPVDSQSTGDVNSEILESEGEVNSETQESEGGASSCRWTPPAVLLLLETYRSMEGVRNRGKISQKQMWIKIAQKLNEKEYTVTGPQCDSKLRSLKKTYKATKDHNNKSGNNRKTWSYFKVMDEMFSQNAWCDPVAVASSTGISLKKSERQDSAVETDSGCSSSELIAIK